MWGDEMIVVYLFISSLYSASSLNPIPPMADLASCQRVVAAMERGTCVQVLIPAPSDKAHWFMPNRIGEEKK